MTGFKEFWNQYKGAIIGVVIAVLILITRLQDLILAIVVIVLGALIGNYVQQNKDTVKIGVKVNDEIPTTGLSPVGTLRFTKGNFSGNEVDIRSQQEIMIGRSSQYCQIILTEQDISRKHCSIKYEYQGSTSAYYVTDYSTFGVIVNDSQKLEKGVTQRLPKGTKLTLGQGSNEMILG